MSIVEDVVRKLTLLKRLTGWGLGAEPQPPEAMGASFCNFLEKKSDFNATVLHFASVQSHLKELDFYHLKANCKN